MIRILILFFGLSLFLSTSLYADKSELKKLILNLKEASYTDSARVFQTGRAAIKEAYKLKDYEAMAEINIYFGNYFFYVLNITKAKYYFDRALLYARICKSKHFQLLARTRLVFLEIDNGNQNFGEKDLLVILEEAKKVKDSRSISELYNLMGIIKEDENQPQEAANFYLKGLSISQLDSLEYYPAVFYNNLGLMKLYSNQLDSAMSDFKKGLAICKKENNQRLINHIQINICLVLIGQKKYTEANKLYNVVLNYSRKNKFPVELASTLLNFASTFTTTEKKELALPYYDSAIVILQKTNLYSELAKAYLGKADVHIALNQNEKAAALIKGAGELNKKTGVLDDIANYYMTSYRFYNNLKDYKNALNSYLSYTHTKDSINDKFNSKTLQELELKYASQQKEIQLEKERSKSIELEKKHQREKYLREMITIVALTIILLLCGFFYIQYSRRLRKSQENFSRQLIEATEEERARIARDLHDELGQTLSIIKSKVSKIGGGSNLPALLEPDLNHAIEQTREISRNLYPSVLEKVGLTRSIASLLENIQENTSIQCSFEVTEAVETLPLVSKTHLFRILQECINNTIKHAEASGLKVSITESNDKFQFIYQDNGKGISGAKNKFGVGVLSIKQRVNILNGSISFDDKNLKGFKLIINFNKETI